MTLAATHILRVRSRRLVHCVAVVAFLHVMLAQSMTAQTVRGVVRDSASHQPIPAVVVLLLDSSGVVLSRNITDERGQYRIVFKSNARSARVIRIGFRPRDVPLPPNADAVLSLDVSMAPVSTMLSAVRILEKSNCPRRADDASALGLWEQARGGLLATIVAREANPASMERLVFERRFDGRSDHITRFSVEFHPADRADKSFNASFPARVFVDSGFASDSAGVQLLFGPDADVLLDEAFAKAYCFRLVAPARARRNQVGLAFAPAQRARGRVDVDGTLWVDTAARALTEIEFSYLGLPRYTDDYRPGGRVWFRQMTNGLVLIDRWQLRGVVAANEDSLSSGGPVTRRDMSAIEFGGELAHATWPDGRKWNASLGVLRVHSVTSAGQPAAGAVVALRDTHYLGGADLNGDLTIDDLLPGPYWPEVKDPRVSVLGISIPTPVTFVASRDSIASVTLKIPTAEEFVVSRCIEMHQWKSGSFNLLLGRVMASGGAPVNDATVTYAVKATSGAWQGFDDNFTTGADGVFQSCNRGLAAGATVRIRVRRSKMDDVDTTVTLSRRLTVVRVQLP